MLLPDRRFVFSIAIATLFIAAVPSAGPKPPVNTNGQAEIALSGYDVVAYFDGRAAPGNARFEHRWNGALWRFASEANRDRFAKDPEKYAPQFGGYCAWAVSRGYTADVDPEAFRVVNGRLYLNYSKSVQRRWEQDVPGNISKAEANWPGVLQK
jgi:YHS domain-containing protein